MLMAGMELNGGVPASDVDWFFFLFPIKKFKLQSGSA